MYPSTAGVESTVEAAVKPAEDVAVEVQAAIKPAAPATARARGRIEQLGIKKGFPTKMLAMVFASVWLIIAGALPYENIPGSPEGYPAYAISVGVVGLVLSLSLLLQHVIHDGKGLSNAVGDSSFTVLQTLAMFLVLWWGVGAGVCTFLDPFKATTNGYFALWGGFVAAVLALADVHDSVRDRVRGYGATMRSSFENEADMQAQAALLGCAALVVLLACIEPAEAGEAVFGIVAGVLTILISLVLVFAKFDAAQQRPMLKALAAFLLVLWVVAAGVLTFRLFVFTGNGFFGSYLAAFFAFKLFAIYWLEEEAVPVASSAA